MEVMEQVKEKEEEVTEKEEEVTEKEEEEVEVEVEDEEGREKGGGSIETEACIRYYPGDDWGDERLEYVLDEHTPAPMHFCNSFTRVRLAHTSNHNECDQRRTAQTQTTTRGTAAAART
jgi:hypothetical protein